MEEAKNKIETDWAIVHYSNGIVYGMYKNVEVDIEAAKEVTAARIKIHEGIPAVLIVDVSKMKSVSKEARTYFSKHGSQNLKATAIIITSGFTSMLANFFMRVNFKKPQVPTRIFSNKVDATAWIEKYK